jgi:hypothetical protein
MEATTQTLKQSGRIYDPEKQRAYYERFYERCKDKGQMMCPLCLGHYTYFNKSHHNKGLHHQRAVALAQRIKEMKAELEGKSTYKTLDTIITFEDLINLPPLTPSCQSVASTGD